MLSRVKSKQYRNFNNFNAEGVRIQTNKLITFLSLELKGQDSGEVKQYDFSHRTDT